MPGSLANSFMKAIITSPLHSLLGQGFAVITVRGRRTGKVYATPINVLEESDGFTVVSLRSRTWWRNLRGGASAELRVGGVEYTVQGQVIEEQEQVGQGLDAFFRRIPGAAKYYGIHVGPDGQIPRADLEKAASERVIIRLKPVRAAT